jgi:polysaccharide export outer membrane protein
MRRTFSLVFVCLLPGSLLGQAPVQAAAGSDPQYTLGPDDQLRIWALGIEELNDKPVRVDPSGNVDLPVIGRLQAGGSTIEQFKSNLTERLSKEVLNPRVSVEVVEFGSQPVSVMGAVNRPGVHQLRGRKTLMEVVSMAEGLRLDAGPHIHISRQIQYGPVPLPNAQPDSTGQFSVAEVPVHDLLNATNPAENILILPHDVVTIPPAEAVFVMGEVKKPGEVALKDRPTISVLQALASAEGFGVAPAPREAKIVRLTAKSERLEIPVDLVKIQQGKAEDIAMRPNDILVVPPSGPKKAAAKAVDAAVQAAVGIAIWRRP